MSISNLRDITIRDFEIDNDLKSPLDDIPITPTLPSRDASKVFPQPFPFTTVWAFYRRIPKIRTAIDLILKYANKDIKLGAKEEFENPDEGQQEFLNKLVDSIRPHIKCILADLIALNNAFVLVLEQAGIFQFKHIPGYSMHVAKDNEEEIEWYSISQGIKSIPFTDDEVIHFKDICLDQSHKLSEPVVASIVGPALAQEFSRLTNTAHWKHGITSQGFLVTPPESEFEEKEGQDKIIENQIDGYLKQGKLTRIFTDDPNNVKFVKVQLELQANLYEMTQVLAAQDIYDAFLIPAPLVGGQSKGVYTGTLEQYFRIFFNQVIIPLQKDVSDKFDEFFERILGEKPQWKIVWENGEIIPRSDQLASLTNFGRMWMELMREGKITAEEVIEKIEAEEKKLKTLGTV